jgi:hypothetical protein
VNLKQEDIAGVEWIDINQNPLRGRVVVIRVVNSHRRLLFSQDGLCCMNLVEYSKINCLKIFIEIETVDQIINFQYND